MSLKEDIVIVNEFTVKGPHGKGSRGSTPGKYLSHYMGRDDACESIYSNKAFDSYVDYNKLQNNNLENFVERYMGRDSAVENLITTNNNFASEIKHKVEKYDAQDGIAFSNESISLTTKAFRKKAKTIQKVFSRDKKTVLKTVLSFSEDYLKKNGIINKDFVCEKAGDYRGNIDQAKLRMAIMDGLENMSKYYDDLKYVGVIQVDTSHVHCHLVMYDKGNGTLVNDTQRGKIPNEAKVALRRGIDKSLGNNKHIVYMASNYERDRDYTKALVKKVTSKLVVERGVPQFLLTCLPENQKVWSANTNRKEMKKANQVAYNYVKEVLDKEGLYTKLENSAKKYLRSLQKRDGFSNKEFDKKLKNSMDTTMNACINGVYNTLKKVDKSLKNVETPTLSMMSVDYDDLKNAQKDELYMFGYNLRTYNSRLKYHTEKKNKYNSLVESYEKSTNKSLDSQALYDFFKFERDYHKQLMVKYQYFLNFIPEDTVFDEELSDLIEYKTNLDSMELMAKDYDMVKMKPANAEKHGREVYGLYGGEKLVTNRDVFNIRLNNMRRKFSEKFNDLSSKLEDQGVFLDNNLNIVLKKPYEFNEVKALDIHHLNFDFMSNQKVSTNNINTFANCSKRRYDLYKKAENYLVNTGQSATLAIFEVDDINTMALVSDNLAKTSILKSDVSKTNLKSRNKTISLDVGTIHMELEDNIKQTVNAIGNDLEL